MNLNQIDVPTLDKPFIIESVKLFSDRLEFGEYVVVLDEIFTVGYMASEQTINFNTRRSMVFGLEAKINNEVFTVSLANPNGSAVITNNSKDTFQKLSFVKNYISKYSFEKRLFKYKSQLKTKGFFIYNGFEFFENGIIKKEGREVADILNASFNNLIGFGTYWQGAMHQYNTEINSNQLLILSGRPRLKIFGFETGISLKIEAYIDTDVFFCLLNYLIENKEYPI